MQTHFIKEKTLKEAVNQYENIGNMFFFFF